VLGLLGQSISVENLSIYASDALTYTHPISLNCAYSGLNELVNKKNWTIYNRNYNSVLSLFLQQDQIVYFNILELLNVRAPLINNQARFN